MKQATSQILRSESASQPLPRFMAMVAKDRALFAAAAAMLPRKWALPDKVLILLEPSFRKDVRKFYAGSRGNIGEDVPAHVLEHLDSDLSLKAAEMASLLAAGGSPLHKAIAATHSATRKRQVGGTHQLAASGSPPKITLCILPHRNGWLVELNRRGDGMPPLEASETALAVAQCIVDHQRAFFESAEGLLRPLTLRTVAQLTGFHESTISRLVSRVLLETPRGNLGLKSLFVGAVPNTEGGVATTRDALTALKDLLQNEDSFKPLTDDDLRLLLRHHGIQISRRTACKYREALGYPSAAARKRSSRAT